ncbi:MAG: hypothetical protein JWR74_1514 [Polaromonas sp.]|nr:hypothetical protein [Polaromonas sp.]
MPGAFFLLCSGPALLRWLAAAACVASITPAQAQGIASTTGLAFGSFVAGTGGTIVVTSNGGRSKTGGVMLLPQGGSAAAQFTVSGILLASYVISLPANDTVVLSNGLSHTMTIKSFVSLPSPTGTLSLVGTQRLSVGATLTVGNAQPPGNYTGTFPVTANYN